MRGPSAQYLSLPFSDAIAFFRQKVNLPTEAWDDLWKGMHSRAFVVAGAMKADLLTDMRAAVDKAISKGTTLAEFRKDFDTIVEKHGWKYKGGRDWRSRVIYQTNVATAYNAGNHKAMTDPAVLAVRPWWRYLASDSKRRRQEHMQWYNLVLRHDDPFWRTHSPQNGWGCRCGKSSLSTRQRDRLIQREKNGANPVQTKAPKIEYDEWTNKKTGEIHKVPKGIDPGWDYNVGEAAWGSRLSQKTMDEFRALKSGTQKVLTTGNWQTAGLPGWLAQNTPVAAPGPRIRSTEPAIKSLEDIIGGEEQIYSFTAENGYRHDLLVNAKSIIKQIDMSRTRYLPSLPETLTDPGEVWQRFEQHKETGKVTLRQRIIKVFRSDHGRQVAVCDVKNGWIESWQVYPFSNWETLNDLRTGQIAYRKSE